MMDAIATRLRETVPALRTVAGAGEYAALKEIPAREKMPAAFVLPMDDSGQPNRMASQVLRQQVDRRISVVLLTRNASDTRGEKAAELLEPTVALIRAALVGWTPVLAVQPAEGAALSSPEPLEFRRGRLIGIEDGVLSWSEEYACRAVLSVTPSEVP